MTGQPPISLWDSSSAEPPVGSPLCGDTACDVAIIGGGYTGLSTALHGAEKGLDCHVLEARTIGFGGSGRNVGLVNAGVWLPPDHVLERLGPDLGGRLIARLGAAPDHVFSLIDKYEIVCEATRNGTIHAAHSPKGLTDLRHRAAQWQRIGAPVELLSASDTAERIGTTRFFGGLLDRRAGTINPMGYARGLARAALAAGARISTEVSVLGLERQGNRWAVRTAQGAVTARNVVIATNAYSDDLWPGLRQSYTPIHFFQLSTEPLGDRVEDILPGGEGLWDTAPVMFSLRRDAFGRLIIGSMGAVHGGLAGLSRRWAARNLRRLFPQLGPVSFDHAWAGRIAMTPDYLFRIHRLSEGLYTPIGYNGRGIITGTIFGQALADLLSGAGEDTLPVPITDLKPVSNRLMMTGFYHTAFAANQLIKSL
jgi:glycine/D-amino acid oxidase-like deaminating enzyme